MKDNFDDILKNKWEQFHFPVDEKHREEMIALLDTQKRRRTGLLWWWTSLGGVVVAVALLLILQEKTKADKTILPAHPASVSNKIKAIATIENAPSQISFSYDTVKTEVNASNHSASSVLSDIFPKATPSGSSSSYSSSKNAVKSFVKVSEAQKRNGVKSRITNKALAGSEKTLKTNNLEIQLQKSNIPESPVGSKEEVVGNQENEVNIIEQVVLAQRDGHITDYLPLLDIRNFDYSLNNSIETEATVIKRHPIRMFAEAGTGLVFGSKPDFKSGYTVHLGGGFDYGLSQRTHLLVSGGYLLQKDGFDFERTSTVEQLSFGSRSSFHTLTPDKLHFMYTKAGLRHRIQRHVISVFGGFQYLYGAQGDITIQVNDPFLGASTDHSKENVWLKLDGMQQYLIHAELLYGYQITPKLSLHSGIRYYFTGIEAKNPELVSRGFYWHGDYSKISPFFTLNYQLYGTR